MYEPLFQHPGIRALQKAARREQYRQLVAFSLLLASGLVFCCFAFQDNALLTILGAVLTVLSLMALWYVYKNWNDDRLLHLLRFQSRQIVWIYSIATQVAPFGIYIFRRGTLVFKLSDGEEISISVPARKVQLISRTLNRLLPYTTFGYTPEREAQFRKSPLLLRKDNV